MERRETHTGRNGNSWTPTFNPVVLKKTQVTAANRMLAACMVHGMAFNSTPTGGGKTPISMWLVQQVMMELQAPVKIITVGPTNLDPKRNDSPWRRESIKYKMQIGAYLPYEGIRGKRHGNYNNLQVLGNPLTDEDVTDRFTWVDDNEREDFYPNADLLMSTYCAGDGVVARKDVLIDGEWISEFSPTMGLMQYFVDNNVFLFVEEFQHTKNETSTNSATAAVIRAARRAYEYKGHVGVYICFISASPVDSDRNSLNIFKLMGTKDPVHSGEMFDMFVRTESKWPLIVAYNQSMEYAPNVATAIIAGANLNATNTVEVHKKATRLLNKCVMPRIHFSAMVVTPKQLWNAFLDITSAKDIEGLKEAEAMLNKVRTLQQKGNQGEALTLLGKARRITELSISKAMTLDAIMRMTRDPNCKCLIVFDHIDSVNRAIKTLKSHGYGADKSGTVARIAGVKDSEDDLEEEITKASTSKDTAIANNRFQQDDNSLRVIVAIASRIASGFDFQDTHGGRQRWTYIAANYNRLKSEQIYGRTPRVGSRSVPQIMVCYPRMLGDLVMRVYDSHQTKSTVLAAWQGTSLSEDSTQEERIIFEDLVKTPKKYDVYIQLECEELSYYKGSPWYDYEKEAMMPDNPDNYFYVGEDTDEGRENFGSIRYMVDYLTEQCSLQDDERELDGIYFSKPVSSKVVPKTGNL